MICNNTDQMIRYSYTKWCYNRRNHQINSALDSSEVDNSSTGLLGWDLNGACLPASCVVTSSWWKRLGPTSTEWPATTGYGRLPLVSNFIGSAKHCNPSPPRDLIPRNSSQASVRNWSTTTLGLPGMDWGSDLWPQEWERESTFTRVGCQITLATPYGTWCSIAPKWFHIKNIQKFNLFSNLL